MAIASGVLARESKKETAPSEWISVSRAMQLLERSRTQISHYIESGLLRERRIGALGWRAVPSEDVQKILDSREEDFQNATR